MEAIEYEYDVIKLVTFTCQHSKNSTSNNMRNLSAEESSKSKRTSSIARKSILYDGDVEAIEYRIVEVYNVIKLVTIS